MTINLFFFHPPITCCSPSSCSYSEKTLNKKTLKISVKNPIKIKEPPQPEPKESRFVIRKMLRKNRFETETENENEPELGAADCEWTSYSEWSECSKPCGVGSQARHRTVYQKEFGGGRPCTGRSSETRLCNRHHCGSG